MNDLQQNEDALGRYQHPHFNSNKYRVGLKLIIPLDHCSDSVECEWRVDKLYNTSMKLITLDMELASVLMVVKVIVRVKNRVYDISLLSHVNVNEFNETRLFDVRRFAA